MGGVQLSSPVQTTVIERVQSNGFSVGVAEMNGYRYKMEDAHIIYCQKGWGFFGVFDGHGGDKCSKYVAVRIKEKLDELGCPSDGPAVKELILGVDRDFLETGEESGSTAAMCIVHAPDTPDGKYRLRTVNAGDSRVLLGRLDGTIVDGGGTDQGLTVDHKPDHPVERERIERLGGTVERMGPCARVNGELAVSRGFGDKGFKKPGYIEKPEDCLVTANPDLESFECDQADFLLIVCDGVSEGDFPNPEVVKLVAERLKQGDCPSDAAEAVLFKALDTNSKDNITCMVILFNDLDVDSREVLLKPGPIDLDNNFLNAYKTMAEKAGSCLRDAVEQRYLMVVEELEKASDANKQKLTEELKQIGRPPGQKGDEEWNQFFDTWEEKNRSYAGGGGRQLADPLQRMLMQAAMRNQGVALPNRVIRRVRVPDLLTLRKSVNDHPAIDWNDKMESLAGEELEVLQDDDGDGTSKLRFLKGSLTLWLPTDILTNLDEPDTEDEPMTEPGSTGE